MKLREPFLSLNFIQEAKQLQFKKGSDHRHSLELDSSSGSEGKYCGSIVYVIARCGVQGIIYPVKTAFEAKGRYLSVKDQPEKSRLSMV